MSNLANPIYLDHAAATPLDKSVWAAMRPYFETQFANPSSLYVARETRQAVESARHTVADIMGAKPTEIVFTSGGTEGDNLAVQGVLRAHPESHWVTTAIEHDAVLFCAAEKPKIMPVVEEFFFRGFMFSVLAARLGRGLGRADHRRRLRARPRARPAGLAGRARRVRSRVVPALLANRVHNSVYGPARPQQFDHVRRDQRPRPGGLRRRRRPSASAWSSPAAPRCPPADAVAA